jgi:hypothetical protein
VEDEGRDTGSVDKVQLRGKEEVERLGPGHAARAFPHCRELLGTIDARIITPNTKNRDHRLLGLAEKSVPSVDNVMVRQQRKWPANCKVRGLGETRVSECFVMVAAPGSEVVS